MRIILSTAVAFSCFLSSYGRHYSARPSTIDHLKSTKSKSDMEYSKESVVSFLESTIKSMEDSENAVINSDKALDDEVKVSQRTLDEITRSFRSQDNMIRRGMGLPTKPFSLLQTKSAPLFDQDGDEQLDIGSDQEIFRKSSGKMSIIEMARERAAESEKKFHDAMNRLEKDKKRLLKDEAFRRARAAEERRHLHLQG